MGIDRDEVRINAMDLADTVRSAQAVLCTDLIAKVILLCEAAHELAENEGDGDKFSEIRDHLDQLDSDIDSMKDAWSNAEDALSTLDCRIDDAESNLRSALEALSDY